MYIVHAKRDSGTAPGLGRERLAAAHKGGQQSAESAEFSKGMAQWSAKALEK